MINMKIGSFKMPAMVDWLVTIAALAVIVYIKAPQNLWILPYKMLLVCVAAYLAHRLDRTFFKGTIITDPYAEISRALIFLGVVLGLTLGV